MSAKQLVKNLNLSNAQYLKETLDNSVKTGDWEELDNINCELKKRLKNK